MNLHAQFYGDSMIGSGVKLKRYGFTFYHIEIGGHFGSLDHFSSLCESSCFKLKKCILEVV